jgi:hypothetical protein
MANYSYRLEIHSKSYAQIQRTVQLMINSGTISQTMVGVLSGPNSIYSYLVVCIVNKILYTYARDPKTRISIKLSNFYYFNSMLPFTTYEKLKKTEELLCDQ